MFFSQNENYNTVQKNTDDELEFFDIDNPLNHLHNQQYYDNYWNNVYTELLQLLLKSFGVLICIYLDITYIQYM